MIVLTKFLIVAWVMYGFLFVSKCSDDSGSGIITLLDPTPIP